MNILPNHLGASVAGTQRAASKSADTTNQQTQISDQQLRVDNPFGKDSQLAIEQDVATGDSESDGRRLLQRQPGKREESSDETSPKPTIRSVSQDGTGNQIDFDA